MEVRGVFDTNILIDYLNGVPLAKVEISKYTTKIISVITWMEILIGTSEGDEEREVKNFLKNFKIVMIDEQISEMAIKIRRDKKIKLPDAIIWATAIINNTILITRNVKDFSREEPSVRIPY